jgi:DNA invertase Pin-like site-specific DNA recombinase
MQTIGYARVSTQGQSLDVQLEKLKDCYKIFHEKASATSSQREQLKACLDYIRQGDTLVVTRLDRIARSTFELCKIASTLEKKGVSLKVIDQNIDTSDATGKLVFHILGSIAQFETELRAERQKEGVAKAIERGICFGRKKSLSDEQMESLRLRREKGTAISQLISDYGISRASIYNYLNKKGGDTYVPQAQ